MLGSWAGFLLAVLAIGGALRVAGLSQSSTAAGLTAYNASKAQAAIDRDVGNLLVLEGGSHAARGIHPDLLESSLAAAGFDVSVLSFAVPGASHLERLHLLTRFRNQLRASGTRLERAHNLVLLREANPIYDRDPLRQFEHNPFTDRAVAYLDAPNAIRAIRAQWAASRVDPELRRPGVYYQLAQHGLLNGFNVGAESRIGPVEPSRPRFHARTTPESGFVFRDTSIIRQDASLEPDLADRERRAWKRSAIDRPLTERFEPDHLAFFTVPALRRGYARYVEGYRADHPNSALLSYRDAHDLFDSLDDARCWYDTGHLLEEGAEIYTAWLAAGLAESGVLVRR